MVDSSTPHQMILVGNPSTVRGHRTSFAVTATHFFYGVKDNLVARARTEDHLNSAVFCANRERVTCVSLCSDNVRVAFGDEKGKVTIVKFQNGKFEPHKEHFCLTGVVNELLWSTDGKCLVAIGENKGQLAAMNPESGSRMGEITGVTATVLCGVLTAKKVLFTAGESNELLRHDGIPFKGQGKKVEHPHSGFINQMRLSPDGSKFATCSADKTIAVFDSDTGALIKHYKAAHAMGIYDLDWINDSSFLTCSADNLVKKWSLDSDSAVQEYEQGYAREIPSQLLTVRNLESCVFTVGLSGEFTEWSDSGMKKTQRHKDFIDAMVFRGANIWFTSEGLVYRMDTAENSIHKIKSSHTLSADNIASNSDSVFSTGFDKSLLKYSAEENKEVAKMMLPNKALTMTASDEHVYVLCMNNEIVVINAKDLSIKCQKKVTFDATAMANCGAQVWVGDKKGNLHVLDANLDVIKTHEGKHSKSVTKVASNGQWVASGDAYRYFFVFNGETHEQQFDSGDHKDKISDLAFGVDHVVSITIDNAFGVSEISAKKFVGQHKLPHAEKLVLKAMVGSQMNIVTLGADCCLRSWPLV